MIVIYKKYLDFLIFFFIFKCLCIQESCLKNKQICSIIILKKKEEKKKEKLDKIGGGGYYVCIFMIYLMIFNKYKKKIY